MKKIVVFILAMFLLMTYPAFAGGDMVEAYIIERSIIYPNRGNLGIGTNYPTLSYSDLTYVSVKDVAKVLGCEAIWDSDTDRIVIKQPSKDKYVIKNDSTALSIGKAIINEYFGDKMTETTGFSVSLSSPISVGFQAYRISVKFTIEQKFNDDTDLSNYILASCDAFVKIDPANGEILEICYKDNNGEYTNIIH